MSAVANAKFSDDWMYWFCQNDSHSGFAWLLANCHNVIVLDSQGRVYGIF